MMTKNLSKTLMAASLVVALGAAGVAPAMANGAAMQSSTDSSVGAAVSDSWITTKVKADFATTKGVDVTDVSVDTKDGVVTLTGTVDSSAEKQMAITSAKSVEGVKAVQADKLMVDSERDPMTSDASMASNTNDGPSSDTSLATKASDTWITTKVKSDFATTKGVDVTDVSVDTKAGVVMLSGTVDSSAEKQMAIKSAQSVKGVKAVQADKLMVDTDRDPMKSGAAMESDTHAKASSDTSLATKAADTWITTKVKSDFATTKGVDVTDVSVDTVGGVVTLSGTVDSAAEKRTAIKSARSVKGVKAVYAHNLVVGKADGSMGNHAMHDSSMSTADRDSASSDTSLATKASDTWITTKVKSNFATTKGVDVTDVSVDTKAGVVMLTGMVGSEAEKQMAIKSAQSIKGVKAVQADKLTVGKEDHAMDHSASSDTDDSMSSDTSLATKASDTWITTKVKADFATTKGVDVTDVSVDTKAGVVMLTGTVGSEAEKQMAIQAAKSVKGVKAVEAGKLMVGNEKL